MSRPNNDNPNRIGTLDVSYTVGGPFDQSTGVINEIVVALRGLLNSMTMKNQKLATKFVSDCSPELEQLGLGEL